jgi:tetratricopeptide (TPR) repeat protein
MGFEIRLVGTIALAMFAVICSGATGQTVQAAASSQALRQQAMMLENEGKNPEAEAAWQAFAKAHPANAEPYAHMGLMEARQEHYKEAAPFYRKALALDPRMPGLRLNLGLALFKGGALKQSLVEFTPLLKAAPAGSAEAQKLTILVAMAHYGVGEYALAVPYLKAAAGADAQNLPLRLALAHSCLWSKQYQCVLDVYHEILTLNAESAEADMLAGEAQDELKEYDGAIAEFRAAVKADPKEPNVHFGLGYLLWTQRQYPEAAQEFQAELANDPNHAQATAYLADTDIQLNHPELATPLLERVAKADPGLALPHLDLGILYTDGGRQADALRELNAAVKLTPDDVNAHWRLGRLLKSMGKKDEAKAEFEKASSLHKATDDALLTRMNGATAKPKHEAEPGATPPQN